MVILYHDQEALLKGCIDHQQNARGKAAPIANILRNRGFDVVCTHEVGRLEATDADQLIFAVSQGRAIVTHNKKDFFRLHSEYMASGRTHCGIILATRRQDNYEVASRLLKLLDAITADEMMDQLRYV